MSSKVFFLMLLVFLTNIGLLYSQNRLIIGNVTFNGDVAQLNPFKLEQALNFVSITNPDKFTLISSQKRDSLIKLKFEKNIKSNLIDISLELDANYIVFGNVNAFKNLLRTDIILVNTLDTTKILKGYGYSDIKYRKDEDIIYDPAILNSLKRALALAFGDSLMFYDSLKSSFIKPVPLLAIGGLIFKDDPDLQKWYLFDKKEVNSYDAVETIFSEAIKSNDFITIDTETRDSIYFVNKLFVPENFNAPSEHELLALYRMDVEYYITGVFRRIAEGARTELYLYRISNGLLTPVAYATELLPEDSIILFRESLKYLTDKILKEKRE
jgi:hypothetical protein